MAAKASIQDITDAGFKAAQFGTPADWETADTGYLARILSPASIWAEAQFGSGYAAATLADAPATFERLRQAELCYVRAELWKRRAAFIDANAVSSLENLAHSDRREFEAQAARAWQCAEDWMAQAKGDGAATPGSAGVLTYAETGPYASTPAVPGATSW
ncbi:MAG: hypothetical protein ACREPV_01150 [Lysobacter sp.]